MKKNQLILRPFSFILHPSSFILFHTPS